jgi:hypothetical protein
MINMTTSLNGWPVPPKELKRFKVPGTLRKLTLDKDAGRILTAIAADYHKTVRPIDIGPVDEGGYNNRDANGAPGKKSNHASGTAIDLNWSEEGAQGSNWGKKFFSNAVNLARVSKIKKRYGSVVQWGGDWRAKDYMHWEIKPGVTRQQVLDFCKKNNIDENGIRKDGNGGGGGSSF